MTIQPISSTTSLLYLTFTELQERGMHPQFLTYEHTLELAREGLSVLGQCVDNTIELESYPDNNGLLLFIHIAPPTPSVWCFMDDNAFLDAVLSMREILPSPIYCWSNNFWAITDSTPDPRLSEYADLMENAPLLSARLTESAAQLFLNT